MLACFKIVNKRPVSDLDTYVGEIDGANSKDIDSFLKAMAQAFKFPDYFGFNYNALDDCINDLSWINQSNYILYIKNYDLLLKEEDRQTKLDTLSLLGEACKQWANVPNFEGEDDFRRKADFKIYVEQCDAIKSDIKRIFTS